MPDITLSLTTTQANRAAAAIGKALKLKDANGVARSATLAESKTFVADYLKRFVQNSEIKAAQDAVTVAPLDVT